MKFKLICLFVIFSLLLTLCACGGPSPASQSSSQSTALEDTADEGATSPEPSLSSHTMYETTPIKPENPASGNTLQSQPLSGVDDADMNQFIPRPKNPETLSKEQEDKIKDDYVEHLKSLHPDDPLVRDLTPQDIVITDYHGTFNGAVAVFITPKDFTYPGEEFQVKISSVTITFPAGPPFYLYKDSQFKNIQDAYKAQWLNLFDIRDLKYFINGE